MEVDSEIISLWRKYQTITSDATVAAILTQTQIGSENASVTYPDEIEDDPEFMSVDEAANLIKCHQSTIYRLVNGGKLRASRFGRNKRGIRIARAAVDEYLDDTPALAGRVREVAKEKACWR